ncbi:hypothetical protein IRT45_14715 [Nocardia sp. BSTN01]|uniref:SRPBCC family protein n=1 Tax=Nocardia sp. BSTN01 TaxID=2783665 RepID=UPI00188E478B|nr:SRPBCC family protein [Nocardia sp. BSTN01]MBF4998402.1 hypothetical protein [Nocardia sp. BSTN01]
MNVTDAVMDRLGAVVTKAVGAASGRGHPQIVTIGRPRGEVERLWHDPQLLSRVFGEMASVHTAEGAGDDSAEGNRYVWRLGPDDGETVTWTTTLAEEPGTLRFTGTGDDSPGTYLQVHFDDAPQGLGTEVTLSVRAPLPDVLTDTAAFAALYRARALLQTGEIPTLAGNPSARTGSDD